MRRLRDIIMILVDAAEDQEKEIVLLTRDNDEYEKKMVEYISIINKKESKIIELSMKNRETL